MLITIEETTVRELRSVLKETDELFSSLIDYDAIEPEELGTLVEDVLKLYKILTTHLTVSDYDKGHYYGYDELYT